MFPRAGAIAPARQGREGRHFGASLAPGTKRPGALPSGSVAGVWSVGGPRDPIKFKTPSLKFAITQEFQVRRKVCKLTKYNVPCPLACSVKYGEPSTLNRLNKVCRPNCSSPWQKAHSEGVPVIVDDPKHTVLECIGRFIRNWES